METRPSIVSMFHQKPKPVMLPREDEGRNPSTRRPETSGSGDLKIELECSDNSDANTVYSIDTYSDDALPSSLYEFIVHLVGDASSIPDELCIKDIPAEDLDSMLREFVWRLYGEASGPDGWEVSVMLNRMRK